MIAEFGMQNAEFIDLNFQNVSFDFYSALRTLHSEIG